MAVARSCWTHEAVSEGRWWGGWGRADEILVSMMEGGQNFLFFSCKVRIFFNYYYSKSYLSLLLGHSKIDLLTNLRGRSAKKWGLGKK